MAVDFEAADAALFARVSGVTGIRFATRKVEMWANVAPSSQPALMMVPSVIEVTEPASNVRGVAPPMWLMRSEIVLYVGEEELREVPSIRLNQLIGAVCNALLFDPTKDTNVPGSPFVAVPPGMRMTTLGGLCSYCRVSGTIERYEGVLDHIAQAIIPIEMELTS